jgi:hypothetical protein
MQARSGIARNALLFIVLTAGAAQGMDVVNTIPNTSTWVTFYSAGPSWVGGILNAGCISPGMKTTHNPKNIANGTDFYIRTEVMASADCKGTKVCDTRMRASSFATVFVNQSARDPKNCFISHKDQSGEVYVGPAIAACLASVRALAGQVDVAYAAARAAGQIDAAEAARFDKVRGESRSTGLWTIGVVNLGKCRPTRPACGSWAR